MENELIGKPFSSYTPEEFYQFSKSLVKASPNASKEVMGITVSKKLGKLSIRINRTDKTLNREEIEKLVQEYKLDETEVLLYLTKRKIGIFYGDDSSRLFADAEKIRKAKENARGQAAARRKSPSRSKLQQSINHAGMHEENEIRPDSENKI